MAKKAGNTSVKHKIRGPQGGHYIWRAWKTDPKTGEKLYAKDYGFKAWKIWVSNDNPYSPKVHEQ